MRKSVLLSIFISISLIAFSQPTINNVTLQTGNYKIGDVINVTIYADAAGYTCNQLLINGVDIIGSFTDNTDNTYSATYTVQEGNNEITIADDIPVDVTLTNGTQTNYNTPFPAGTVTIDASYPIITALTRDGNDKVLIDFNEDIDDTQLPFTGNGGFTISQVGSPATTYTVNTIEKVTNTQIRLKTENFTNARLFGIRVYIFDFNSKI